MRLLDAFCGAGGAAMGYHRAGFDEIAGVDIKPQPRYPFTFIQGDAIEYIKAHGHEFDVIHASPPCQAYTNTAAKRRLKTHLDLVGPTRETLQSIGVPYVIENVPGAPMPNAIFLCGSFFNLPIIRHRYFETTPFFLIPQQCSAIAAAGTGSHGPGYVAYASGNWGPKWKELVLPVVWPWMTLFESGLAIPPSYTEFIGRQLMQAIQQ